MTGEQWAVPLSILSGAIAVGSIIWRLVAATFAVSNTTKDNSVAILQLSRDIKEMNIQMGDKITLPQHVELINRIATVERMMMHRGYNPDPGPSEQHDFPHTDTGSGPSSRPVR